MKNLRQVLQAGNYLVGSWINTASPIVAELMAAAGFDFLTVDAEHSAVDLSQAQVLLQAIKAGNPDCAPLIRLPGLDCSTTRRYLDAGAAGVIAPLVNSADQVRELVEVVKYPPQGIRGVGFCRANMYGMHFNEAVASANDQTLVCIQIEHIDGVRHIEEILAVPGLDAVFIGPYDLSASMNITGQFDHPDMVDAKQRILSACQTYGIAPGIHVVQPNVDEVVQCFHEGYRLIAYSLDISMLIKTCQAGLSEIYRRLPPKEC